MRNVLLIVLLLVIGALAFLPRVFDTSIGKRVFEKAFSEKFDSTVQIGRVRLTWFGPQAFEKVSLSNPEMTGTIERIESDVPLWSLGRFGQAFHLENGSFAFPKYSDLSIGPVDAKVAGQNVEADGAASQGGRFTLRGKVHSKNDLDLTLNATNFPSAFFDVLLKAKGWFAAASGPVTNLDATLLYHRGAGSIDANLSASNTSAMLSGEIGQTGLTLKKPFAATLHFSPELSQKLGGRILEGQDPITLQLDPSGTLIPLNPFTLTELKVGKGVLNLGRLVCTGLHPLVSLFSLMNRSPIASSTGVIWFTPALFSVDHGLLSLGRVDFLIANAIHLCAWGDISLPDERLQMTLGIPADTLANTLGIDGLSRNYVLKIPVRGTISEPEFQTGSASAKIAAWVAGKQITNKLSKKTGIFGGLLNQITQIKDDDGDAPPPNRPFPWER